MKAVMDIGSLSRSTMNASLAFLATPVWPQHADQMIFSYKIVQYFPKGHSWVADIPFKSQFRNENRIRKSHSTGIPAGSRKIYRLPQELSSLSGVKNETLLPSHTFENVFKINTVINIHLMIATTFNINSTSFRINLSQRQLIQPCRRTREDYV